MRYALEKLRLELDVQGSGEGRPVTSAGDDDRDDDAHTAAACGLGVDARESLGSRARVADGAAREKPPSSSMRASPRGGSACSRRCVGRPSSPRDGHRVARRALILTSGARHEADATATSESSADKNVVERADRERDDRSPTRGGRRPFPARAAASGAPTADTGAATTGSAPVDATLARPTVEDSFPRFSRKEPRAAIPGERKLKAPPRQHGRRPRRILSVAGRRRAGPGPAGGSEAARAAGMGGSSRRSRMLRRKRRRSDSSPPNAGVAPRRSQKPMRAPRPSIEGEDRRPRRTREPRRGKTQPTLESCQAMRDCGHAGDCRRSACSRSGS